MSDSGRGHRDRDRRIIGQFRLGLKMLCGKRIWMKIQEWIEHSSQEDLAARLIINPKQVSTGLNGGSLSLEVLLSVLTDTGKRYQDLDPLPEAKVRFIAGYQRAIEFVKKEILNRLEEYECIQLDDFCALCGFLVARNTVNTDTRDWEEWTENDREEVVILAKEITARNLGVSVNEISYEKFNDFENLIQKWGDEVIPVLEAIPYSWHKWIKKVEENKCRK